MAKKADGQLEKEFAALLAGNPGFNVVLDDGKTWLCPYCGKPAVADRSSPEFEARAFRHVIDKCAKAGGLQAAPLPLARLHEIVELARLKAHYQAEAAWRVRIGDAWLCPFCVQTTSVRMTGPNRAPRPVDDMAHDIHAHFRSCYEYAQDPKSWKTVEQIKAELGERKKEEQLVQTVVDLFGSNPVFGFADSNHHWICPFCETPISSVDCSTPLAKPREAPRQALAHFRSGACRYESGVLDPKKTAEEMQAIAARLSGDKPSASENAPASAPAPAEADYIQSLRDELGEMRSELGRNKKLQEDLERARKAQQRMLPSGPPDVPGYDFDVYFSSCEQVSGDFYDFIRLDDGRIGVVMGDISGHGIDAGIVMGMTKKAFALRAQSGADPLVVAAQVNEDIRPEIGQATFVTAVYGIVDPRDNTFRFVRCGHTFPMLYEYATGEAGQIMSEGLVMGSLKGELFAEKLGLEEIEFGAGDSLVLYTDGIMEAMTEDGEEFGVERVHEAVLRHGATTARGVIEGIVGATQVFTRGCPQNDDVTLIVVRRKCPGE